MEASLFKRYSFRDYPNIGMTTEKWLDIPTKTVNIEDLIATQKHVYIESLLGPETSFCRDMFVHVVEWQGELFLEDGHHRAVRAWINNRETLEARVLTITEEMFDVLYD